MSAKNTSPAPSIKSAISIKGNYITSDTIKHLEHEVSGKPLIHYLMRRNDWTNKIFNSIDWDAHESYLTKLPYLKAVKSLNIYMIGKTLERKKNYSTANTMNQSTNITNTNVH